MSPKPSKSPQVTNTPTSRKATSLTIDSTATAVMSPVCWRVKSRLRAPKRMTKRAERRRHQQGRVEAREDRVGGDHHAEGQRHGLQLQRDVRDHPAHDEDRDQRPQRRRLAVAAGHEVRDGRDALLLGHPDQLAEHGRPGDGDQRRPQVDREELEPAMGGQARRFRRTSTPCSRPRWRGRRWPYADGVTAACGRRLRPGRRSRTGRPR